MNETRKTEDTKTILLCESCEFSDTCDSLSPCDRYIPALSSNFDQGQEYPLNIEKYYKKRIIK